MFDKRFEHEGAAADEPGVDLKNPIKGHGENQREILMTHMKSRLCPSYHVTSASWYLRSSNA